MLLLETTPASPRRRVLHKLQTKPGRHQKVDGRGKKDLRHDETIRKLSRSCTKRNDVSKKQAAKLRNAKKTDGSAAEEEEEEGAGQFSDSDFQHDLPAAKVKRKLLLQPSSPFQC